MNQVTLVWRTDVHLSDRTPSSRTDNWTETVFDHLAQVRDYAIAQGASMIIDGGDFFHIKSPSRNSHELVRRTSEEHSRYPMPVACVPGNHDCVYGDYNFLPQQPLGVLYAAGVFKRLYDGYEYYLGPADSVSANVAVYPYNRETDTWANGSPFDVTRIMDEFPVVRVVGVPFHGNKYDMERFSSLKKGEEDVLICAAHVLASLDGGSMFEGEDIIRYSDLLDTDPDVYCFGHWHMDQGIEELGGKKFINVGSLTRGSLSQDEVQRRPACVGITVSEGGVLTTDIHRLNVKPAEEVFDLERRARQVKRQTEMDGFVKKIRESFEGHKQKTGSLATTVATIEGVPDEVRERANHYLEKVNQ